MNRICTTVRGVPETGPRRTLQVALQVACSPTCSRRYPVSGPPENGPSGEIDNGRFAEENN